MAVVDDTYAAVCEALFEDWRSQRPSPREAAVQRYFVPQALPEPYLVFGEADHTLAFLTTNPGGVLPFQEQSRPESATFRTLPTYAEAARLLGAVYSDPTVFRSIAGRAVDVTSAATRVAAMLALAKALGASGFVQYETIPWHSRTVPDKGRLYRELAAGSAAWREYKGKLQQALRKHRYVVAIAGGSARPWEAPGVKFMAELLGFQAQQRCTRPIDGPSSSYSIALLWRGAAMPTGAVITAVQGSNRFPVPSREPLRSARIAAIAAGLGHG